MPEDWSVWNGVERLEVLVADLASGFSVTTTGELSRVTPATEGIPAGDWLIPER